MAFETATGRPLNLSLALAASLLLAGLLAAATLSYPRWGLASPHLGSELRTPAGAPVPLDEPLDSRL